MESGIRRSRIFVSNPVSTKAGSRFGLARLSMVSQNTRQLRIQNTASSLTSRSAVRNRACSARQPDFRILWKTSIFQRMAYHCSFSTAASWLSTGRSVISFQSMRGRPTGSSGSRACNTVSMSVG